MTQARVSIQLTRSLALLCVALFACAHSGLAQGNSQGKRARVLIVPIRMQSGASSSFGEKIAKQVGDAVKDFPTLTTVEGNELKDALKQYKLDPDQLTLVQWRQLATRLDASLIMYGTVVPAGPKSYDVQVSFVDPRTGDALPVPKISVNGDGSDEVKQASEEIVKALNDQVDFQRALLFCQEYLAAEQYDDAQRNCEQALSINPVSVQALYYHGRVALAKEDYERAESDLQQVVDKDAANTDALQSLAFAKAKLGKSEEAMALYRQFLSFNPGAVEVRLNVAYNLAQAGAYDEAIKLLQEGVDKDSTSVALWKYLGDVALKKATESEGDSASADAESGTGVVDTVAARTAVNAYEHLLALQGDSIDVGVLKNAIAAYLALDDVKAAADFSNRALQKVTNDASLWSLRADVLGRMDDYKGASQAMNRVLAIDSTYQNAYLKRGLFELRGGDESSAVADFKRAINQGSDPNTIANQLLARGYRDYFQKGDYSGAVGMFATALEFAHSPDVVNQLNFFTGYAYFQLGVTVDESNSQAEACAPARRALDAFSKVPSYMQKSGDYQKSSQSQIADNTDVYIYRQKQIIKKACR